MELKMTFRGMDHTDAIEEYVVKNLTKFKKYLGKEDPDATFLHVILEGNHNHDIYEIEMRLKSPHFDIVVEREAHKMYPLIDEVVHIMERELKDSKEKFIDSIQKAKKPNR